MKMIKVLKCSKIFKKYNMFNLKKYHQTIPNIEFNVHMPNASDVTSTINKITKNEKMMSEITDIGCKIKKLIDKIEKSEKIQSDAKHNSDNNNLHKCVDHYAMPRMEQYTSEKVHTNIKNLFNNNKLYGTQHLEQCSFDDNKRIEKLSESLNIVDDHFDKKKKLKNYNDNSELFHVCIKNNEFDKLITFKNINCEQVSLHKIIQNCKSDIIVKHVLDNLINQENYHSKILEFLCKYRNSYILSYFIQNNNIKDVKINELMFYACENKDPSVIEYLIKEFGLDLHMKNTQHYTLLHYAYTFNNKEVFEILLKNNADASHIAHEVCHDGNIEYLKLLIKYKVDLDTFNFQNVKPIHKACAKTNPNLIKLLLDNGADVNSTWKDYNTPLHIAVYYNNYELVKLLLKYEASVNSLACYDHTPFHLACKTANLEIMKILIECGADVNVHAQRNYGDYYLPIRDILQETNDVMPSNIIPIINTLGTELDLTIKMNDVISPLEFAFDYSLQKKRKPLFESAYNKNNKSLLIDMEVTKHLLKHYVEYNTNYNQIKQYYGITQIQPKDIHGMKLIHYACIMEDTEFLEKLIKDKVNIHSTDKFGNTPSHYICMMNNCNMYDQLHTFVFPIKQFVNKYEMLPMNYTIGNNLYNYRINTFMQTITFWLLLCFVTYICGSIMLMWIKYS